MITIHVYEDCTSGAIGGTDVPAEQLVVHEVLLHDVIQHCPMLYSII